MAKMEGEVMSKRVFGGSLPVDNVQALASKDMKVIHPRYIHPELDFDVVSINGSLEIPVIDLGRLVDQQFGLDELAKFHSACKDWGFFQLINHEASDEIVEKMKADIEEFFRQSLKEKKAYSQLPNIIEGYGQTFVVLEEQKLDCGDMLFLHSLPIPKRNMRFWPN